MRTQEGGLIGAKPTAAIDATGMESRHTSRYFFKRAGRKHNSRLWTKLAVACDTASHFFTAATVSLGPANDAPQFRPLMAQASLAVGYDRVLGDAAFDGEESHRYCREDLGVRSTVIPINRRNGGRKWPKTRYRRQMVKRFRKKPRGSRHKRVYGQRWQAETPSPDTSGCSAGAAGQVGCIARTRVLPAGTHPQPHAPRRYRLEDFNRAGSGLYTASGLCASWPLFAERPAQQPGPRSRLHTSESLTAAPVCCSGWFGTDRARGQPRRPDFRIPAPLRPDPWTTPTPRDDPFRRCTPAGARPGGTASRSAARLPPPR